MFSAQRRVRTCEAPDRAWPFEGLFLGRATAAWPVEIEDRSPTTGTLKAGMWRVLAEPIEVIVAYAIGQCDRRN